MLTHIRNVSFFDYQKVTPEKWRAMFDDLVLFLKNFTSSCETRPLLHILEYRHRTIMRVLGPFYVQHEAHHSEWSTQLSEEFLPKLTEMETLFFQNEKLFARLKNISKEGLDQASQKLKADYEKKFIEAGCGISLQSRTRLLEINKRLAELGNSFQNALLAANAKTLAFSRADMAGVDEKILDELEKDGKIILDISRGNADMVLENATNRDTRKRMHAAFLEKNTVHHPVADFTQAMLNLRQEKARLLGFSDFAHMALADKMAENPDNVLKLLDKVWQEALPRAETVYRKAEALALQEGIRMRECDTTFYIKKSSQDASLSPVNFPLNFSQTLRAAMQTAENLFGLVFSKVEAPSYHEAVDAFVVEKDGRPIGGFLADYQKRPTKSPGAWMNSMFEQSAFFNDLPVVINVGSFYDGNNKNAPISFDDAVTIFHELGHGLHGLMSQVQYPSQSGTNVTRDFVELPSQLMENWVSTHEGLLQCGISEEDAAQVLASRPDDSWTTSRYLASAFFDHALHTGMLEGLSPESWRAQAAARFGIPGWLPPHHEMERFSHIWGGGYECGYYSYLWAETLEADLFSKFAGNLFGNQKTALLLYASGSAQKENDLFRQMMGRDPSPSALFHKKGWDRENVPAF